MSCAPGHASTIEGASAAEDGCTPCEAGTYADAESGGVCLPQLAQLAT